MGGIPTKEEILNAINNGNFLIDEVKNSKYIYIKTF
jgi:hypothetical protein